MATWNTKNKQGNPIFMSFFQEAIKEKNLNRLNFNRFYYLIFNIL